MTRTETAKLFALLKSYFPNTSTYLTPEEADLQLNSWSVNFMNSNFDLAAAAVILLAETTKNFAPSIAAIKEKMKELKAELFKEPTDEEYWKMVSDAVSNGIYGAKEEFKKLPEVLRKFCGGPGKIASWARMDQFTFNRDVHKEFLSFMKDYREKCQTDEILTPAKKEQLRAILEKESAPALDESSDSALPDPAA